LYFFLIKVPPNFNEILRSYTANGYRVIALAGKPLDASLSWSHAMKLTRETVESELIFYGLLIMQNMIKPETTPIIAELTRAGIGSVMVTGDNLLTAICVARKCGMVPKSNRVIVVEAHPAQEFAANEEGIQKETIPARIEWKLADGYSDIEDEQLNDGYQSGGVS
jgi:magnesium-transporting ATPase (P-type)